MAKDPIKKADNGTYYFRANLGYNPITADPFFYSEENFQISCRTGKRITDLPGNKIYIRKIVNYAKSENMNFL